LDQFDENSLEIRRSSLTDNSGLIRNFFDKTFSLGFGYVEIQAVGAGYNGGQKNEGV
jgi:hypothetical protein